MRLSHGRLEIDVPAGWSDQSTLVLVGPPPQPSAPVLKTRAVQPSVIVTWARKPGGDARGVAQALLEEELQGLRATSPDVTVLATGPLPAERGIGVTATLRLSVEGVPLRQVHVVLVHEPLVLRAVASAGEPDFAATERTLRDCLESLRVSAGAPGGPR